MKYSVIVKLNKDFIEVADNKISIGIKSKPQRGKANDELLKKLAKHFQVSIARIKIISGKTSRKKLIDVDIN